MATTTDYAVHLEALRRAEKMASLQQEGYSVQADVDLDGQKVDLVAVKNGHTVVYEFKAAGQLRPAAEEIQRLREVAKKKGFDFRLVIAQPPKAATIEIENLPAILAETIVTQRPGELYRLSPGIDIAGVKDVDITSIEIDSKGLHIAGAALLEVFVERGADDANEPLSSFENFPLAFQITLGHDLQVVNVGNLAIDTSDF